jgi:N-acetylglucosamine kinase-like BadF-type ATPase
LGTDFDSVWHRVDGWGHLLGDDGSGVWIGMHGLRAALRAHDGRIDGSTTLEEMAVARFGSPEQIVSDVYTRADRAGLMATFAPDVFSAAKSGDSVATAIVERAGVHLADTAAAAVERSGQLTVAHAGRLFEAGDILLEPMRSRLRELTALELVAPLGTPLDGAMALARLAADQPARVPHSPHHLITMIGDAA